MNITSTQIGVQMMMLKQKVQEEGLYNVLKKVSDLGYNAIEISQIDMNSQNI
ncbi:hypothetical protein [Staphylococcus cohnii]|nr:hypothetical protein [Staphylococcus cohnii]